MTTYAAEFGILDAARRLEGQYGAQGAERKATEYGWRASRGSERRDFWMNVAQVCADFRAEFGET